MPILGDSSPFYPLWAAALVALSLILIPRNDYRYLLPHGLLGALITSLTLLVVIHGLKAWKYVEMEPFSLLGIPCFIQVSWGVSVMIFLWALPVDMNRWIQHLYIAIFAICGVILDSVFHGIGLRPYAPWYKPWMWFFVSYGLFWVNHAIYRRRKASSSSPC